MSEATFYTETKQCDGCGSRIEITNHENGGGKMDAVAKVLGWTTVDKGKKVVEIFCPWCVERAQRIVRTAGTGRAA